MSVENKTSRFVWAYETTPRTSAIVDATSITYDFGEYDESIQKWKPPTIENRILSSYVYNKRTPTLSDGRRKFPTFNHMFNPTTPQWLLWILGKCTDGAPDSIEPLDSGYQYPLTIRHEEGGGTNDTFAQAVSSWCVSAYFRAAIKDPFVVDLEFAFEQFQDHDDELQLTTAPRRAGHTGVERSYNGVPTVTYDPDGNDTGPTVIPQVVKAEGKITQNYSNTLNGAETAQTVYKRNYDPIPITLQGVHVVNDYWDQFMDRNQEDWEVDIYKPDDSYYIKMKLNNCIPQTYIKEGQAFKGWYLSTLVLLCEEITATFAWDGSDTWANHFKGEVV